MHSAKTKEQILILQKNGHDINFKDAFGNTALHKAVMKSNKELIRNLIDCGSNVHIKNDKGNTPIFYTRNSEIVDIFLAKAGPSIYADFNNENKNYHSYL